MLQSTLVYGTLGIVMILCGCISARREQIHATEKPTFFSPEIIISLVSFAIVFGCRYNVGIDHLTYLEFYNDIATNTPLPREDLEWGYLWITEWFAQRKIHYAFYFGSWALLQLFFIYYGFKNDRYLYPFIAFNLIFGTVFLSWMNGMRQWVACCIFLGAIQLLFFKKYLFFFLSLVFCCLFHKTAILLFPISAVIWGNIDYFKKTWIQLVCLFGAILLRGAERWLHLFTGSEHILEILGFGARSISIDTVANATTQYNFGIRSWINFLIIFLIVLFSVKLKDFFKRTIFLKYYNLFFPGCLLEILLAGNHILLRPFLYLYCTKFIIISYFMYYLWVKRNESLLYFIIFIIIILVQMMTFFSLIYLGASPEVVGEYTFFWQND